jgi:hypothetical protein
MTAPYRIGSKPYLIVDSAGVVVADTLSLTNEPAVDAANAVTIVNALNNHDALIEALSTAILHLDYLRTARPVMSTLEGCITYLMDTAERARGDV